MKQIYYDSQAMITLPSNSTLVNKHDVNSMACLTGNFDYELEACVMGGFKNTALIYDVRLLLNQVILFFLFYIIESL